MTPFMATMVMLEKKKGVHHGHATVAGERGRMGLTPSSTKHSTSVPVPMQSTASMGDGGKDALRRAAAVAGRRTSKEAAQAPVRGAQCLREGLMSSIYRLRWSRARFLVAIWVLLGVEFQSAQCNRGAILGI
jgi:hypothetical protein